MVPTNVVHARARRGFALLAVLWLMVGVATLALGVSLLSRDAVAASSNRLSSIRAYWHAEDCLARIRSTIASALETEDALGQTSAAWAGLDSVVAESALLYGESCSVEVDPVGIALDVNDADSEVLRRHFRALGLPGADSLADALLDWRDRDDEPRAAGAERDWYVARARHPPRNAPLAHLRELSRVRGFEQLAGELESTLSVEPGPVVLSRAPLAVLRSLPGMTDEATARIADWRATGERWTLVRLARAISPASRDSLMSRYRDLERLTTTQPEAWIVRSTAADGPQAVPVRIEVKLLRAGRRAAIVRRQVWR